MAELKSTIVTGNLSVTGTTYCDNIIGTITNAINATYDGNNNEITTTYINQKKLFIGTSDDYKIAYAEGKIAIGALVIITDDETTNSSTSAILGQAILGQMILG